MTTADGRRRVIAQQWLSVDGFAAGYRDESELFAAVSEESTKASERHNQALLPDVEVVAGSTHLRHFRRVLAHGGCDPSTHGALGQRRTQGGRLHHAHRGTLPLRGLGGEVWPAGGAHLRYAID